MNRISSAQQAHVTVTDWRKTIPQDGVNSAQTWQGAMDKDLSNLCSWEVTEAGIICLWKGSREEQGCDLLGGMESAADRW